MSETAIDHVLSRLHDLGIKDVFGVAGDFAFPIDDAVTNSKDLVRLTPKQFDLLHCLMANAGKPVPHAKLLWTVWGPGYGNELEYLRTFVRQVRMKIEDDPTKPTYLLTEPHIGYRFSESGIAGGM
jgi:two-component system KDP operon response regulator KdpE